MTDAKRLADYIAHSLDIGSDPALTDHSKRLIIRALRAQEGMVMMPREPTNELLLALMLVKRFNSQEEVDTAIESYKSLIAAAQPTEQNAGEAESKRVSDAPIKHRGEVSASPAPDDLRCDVYTQRRIADAALKASNYPDTEADGWVYCGKCGAKR